MKFRLLLKDPKTGLPCGNHRDGDKTYKPGDVIESDMDLVATIRNKFERIDGQVVASQTAPDIPTPTSPSVPPPAGEGAVNEPAPKPVTPAKKLKLGTNMTDDYSNATMLGYQVFWSEKNQRYTVVDVAGAVLKRFKTPTAVEKFLLSQVP